MENIKEELIKHLGSIYTNQDWDFVVCGFISLYDKDYGDDRHTISLPIDEDVQLFIDMLDFDIHPLREGFESTIWYADGTWSEYIYDYEWGTGEWVKFVCPEIPKSLHKKGE
jgi:hypothetical protein